MMSEEYFKRKFGEILGEGGKPTPKTLTEIVDKSGHSRATVLKWLKKLESSGLITRKPLIKGRGRPKFEYHPAPTLLVSAGGPVDLVSVSFAELQQVCNHQKSEFCEKAVQKCQRSSCPLIKG
jgi:predicted transcriptional regulator